MTIENLGVKLYSGLKQDRKSASLGSSADGTNTGITLVTATSTAEQTTGAEENTLNASDTRGLGEYVVNTSSTLYGKTLTDVQFNMKKATGGDAPAAGEVVRARHYNSSNTLIHTYWTKDATTLPTSFAWTSETTLSGDTAYAVGDYFVCEFTETDGTSPTVEGVKINRKATGSGIKWDSTNSGFINTYFSASNWTDTNRDIQFKITLSDSSAVKLGTGAYSFDGSNDYVIAGSASDWSFLSDGSNSTVAFWYKRNGTQVSSEPCIIDTNGATQSNVGTCIYSATNGALTYYTASGSANKNVSLGTPTDGEWTHLAVVNDGSNLTSYVNGTQEAQTSLSGYSASSSNPSTAYNIGRNGRSGNLKYIKGAIDDMGIYKRALTTTEISALQNKPYFESEVSVVANSPYPNGLAFSPDGTKLFISDEYEDRVSSWALSTAWDITSASHTANHSTSGYETIPTGLDISADGTKMIVSGVQHEDITYLTMSTAFDVSTLSVSGTFDDSSRDNAPYDVCYGDSGTKMYIIGNQHKKIYQFTLSSAYVATGASYASKQYDGSSEWSNPAGLKFNSDGTKVYVSDSGQDKVFQYTCSTAWDISTVGSKLEISVSSQDESMHGIAVKSDDSKIYTSGWDNDKVYQYNDVASFGTTNTLSTAITNKSELKANYTMDSTSLGATADVTDDLTTDKGWVSNTSDWSYNATNDTIDLATVRRSTTAQRIYIDLQDADYLGSGNNLSDTSWVIRLGKFKVNALAPSLGVTAIVCLSDSIGDSGTNQDAVGFDYGLKSTELYIRLKALNGVHFEGGGQVSDQFSSSIVPSTSTSYRWELTRDGNVFTMTAFAENDTTYSTPLETATVTKTGITGLRYFKIINDSEQNNSQTGDMEIFGDIKIYDGVSSLDGCKNDFSSTSALDGVTGIRTNSIFQQTDDTPSYWWFNGTSWVLDGTTQTGGDDITTDITWTQLVGTSSDTFYVVKDTTNKTIDVKAAGNCGTEGSPSIAYATLPSTLSSSAWIMRFKLVFNTVTGRTSYGSFFTSFFIVDNGTGSSGTGSENGFGFKFIADAGSTQTQFYSTTSGTDSGTTMSWTPSSSSTIYAEISWEGGTATANFYSDSGYSNRVSSTTANATRSGTFSGLKFPQIALRQDTGGNGVMDIEMSDLKIQNGTSEWLE